MTVDGMELISSGTMSRLDCWILMLTLPIIRPQILSYTVLILMTTNSNEKLGIRTPVLYITFANPSDHRY
jgi:hypothetical protein